MKRFYVLFLLAILAVIFLLSLGTLASARPSIYDDWTIRYPSSLTDDNLLNAQGYVLQDWHRDVNGGAPYNQYGYAIKLRLDAGDTNDQAFAAVEGLNSDLNTGGHTNLQEINASTQPGWRVGSNIVYDRNGVNSAATAPSGVPLDPTGATTTTTTVPPTTTTTVPPTTTTTTVPTTTTTVPTTTTTVPTTTTTTTSTTTTSTTTTSTTSTTTTS